MKPEPPVSTWLRLSQAGTTLSYLAFSVWVVHSLLQKTTMYWYWDVQYKIHGLLELAVVG